MLTKNDLSQIRKVVREEVGNETQVVRDELQSDITMSRIEIQNEIRGVKDRLKNVEIQTTKVQEGLKNVEIRVTKMHKDLKKEIKQVANFLDKEHMATRKRVERVEEHLGLLTS